MRGLKVFAVLAAVTFLIGALTGCVIPKAIARERPVAKVAANYVYDTKLKREVQHSRQRVRNRERNDYYGFSPLRELKIMYGNLGYLVQGTALVLPAGSLDKLKVKREAERRAKELAQDVYERLLNGESWDKLNQQYSSFEAKDDGGRMIPFSSEYKGVPQELFQLEEGGILPPIEWSFGHSIYRLDSISEGPDGKKMYHASQILIQADESAVKNEMIGEILSRKTVEILDPVLKGFDMYLNDDYKGAIEYLDAELPSPEWTDLGYYIISLCEDALGDAGGRYDYLLKAAESAPEMGGFRPYYDLEIGDILRSRGEESALEYYRAAFDGSANDYDITVSLMERFQAMGDDEYLEKAKERKSTMEFDIQRSGGGGLPEGVIETGDVNPDKPDFDDL